MLAAGAAKYRQGIPGDVVAALHRDLLDRIGHVGIGDIDVALGDLFRADLAPGRLRDGVCKLRKALAHHLAIERRIALRAKDLREKVGLDLAEHHVGIGHGERPAPAIAGRPWIGAGRIRTHPHPGAIEMQDRAAAGGHCVNAHHRRAQPYTGNLRVEDPLEFTGKVRDVGGGAAHVEADDPIEAGGLTDPGHADDAACRPGQDRILALEGLGVGQAAIGLHELKPHARQTGCDLIDIAAQHRRQIGIDHGGVGARHEADQRRGAMRHRDLGIADVAGDFGQAGFVRGIAIGVHQHNRHGPQPAIEGRLQREPRIRLVEWPHHAAIGRHAFIDLDHLPIKHLGQDDVTVKEAGPSLVADPWRIGKAACHHQQQRLALALEQRVGGHGCAHLDRFDLVGRYRIAHRHAKQAPDTGNRGIGIVLRVVGQELGADQRAIGTTTDHIGESAATIDPELPAALRRRSGGDGLRGVPLRGRRG